MDEAYGEGFTLETLTIAEPTDPTRPLDPS